MARIEPVDAKKVAAIPPWDREQFHYKDAPAVIQRLFGFTVRHETIYRWIYKGRTLKSSGQTGYLPAHTMAGRLFVKRADLIKFLEQT
jgi:hypothetical protein